MPVLTLDHHVDAPPALVAGVLRETAVAEQALSRTGARLTAPARLLVAGDEVRVALPGGVLACRTRITRAGVAGVWSELATGPAAVLRHATRVIPDGAGTRVRDELTWSPPFGVLGRLSDPVLRRYGRRLLGARRDVVAERAGELGRAPVVVGAAIVRDGRLLVAQRSYPAEIAGRWELPGGGVEPGESETDALVRECREELGARIRADGRIGTDLPIGRRVLRIRTARLTPDSPDPEAREHRSLRWVGAHEVAALGWLDADRAVVAELVDLLRS
ncbi:MULTISPECIES: NUDIX domain-containing protein [unclassified Pseudonocardia]|uniref:NUDIX domain-containing protein n=1 Tax=unclassified Pseudonocardia TaxID=2619320 RepID=UPI00095DF0D2|nr:MULTISPECIES: NUDIX domain-containing protein [unclassified Pseudonocardia]OLL75747.1 putative mutT-like protein [Pseudonocardia sp. Ae150A_Ps1]OLL95839.1 putative mutT-like protein [Pseudonocardia sp. Ae356_Ps1]